VRRPQVLILDDAMSAVDAVVEQEMLARLRSALVTTTLIVAHRVSTIALADRVLLLESGRIAASGTHDELLSTVTSYEALVRAYEAEEAA
jgi:ATP-binding cassette subfamily B protein